MRVNETKEKQEVSRGFFVVVEKCVSRDWSPAHECQVIIRIIPSMHKQKRSRRKKSNRQGCLEN